MPLSLVTCFSFAVINLITRCRSKIQNSAGLLGAVVGSNHIVCAVKRHLLAAYGIWFFSDSFILLS